MSELKSENDQNSEMNEPDYAWSTAIVTKADDVEISTLVLYRDPVELRLKHCSVDAVMPDIGRIAVTMKVAKGQSENQK